MIRLSTVGRLSVRTLLRDPFLKLMAVLPFGIALIYRFAVPAADAALTGLIDPATFRLRTYYPLISAFLLELTPLFAGGITGFSLLEDRDEGVLTAMAVTPLGRRGYLAARLVFPVLLAVVCSALAVPLAGLHRPEPAAFLIAVVAAAPLAPVSALLVVALAADKVEGLAVWKLLGFLFLGPAVLILPTAAQPVGWPLASYWVARAYLSEGGSAGASAAGFAAFAVLCAVAYLLPVARRLRRL
jgi:hypothetical protein